MTLSNAQRLELSHLWAVTREGSYSYRTPKTRTAALVLAGYAVRGPVEDTYKITPAGIAALQNADTPYPVATVTVWCDDCGAVTAHHCLYDHATGERFACAGCAERIAS